MFNTPYQKLSIITFIGLAWVALDYFNKEFFTFLQVNDFLYSIYWLSGVRLIAVMLFGWLGALGLFFGYVIGGIFLRGFSLINAISLGVLSALAPMLAYIFWRKFSKVTLDLQDLTFEKLLTLILIYAFLITLFRGGYLYYFLNWGDLPTYVLIFGSNILGAFICIYALKIGRYVFKKLS